MTIERAFNTFYEQDLLSRRKTLLRFGMDAADTNSIGSIIAQRGSVTFGTERREIITRFSNPPALKWLQNFLLAALIQHRRSGSQLHSGP